MTHKEAYLMKEAIYLLISITDHDRYCVAVAERFSPTQDDGGDYEVHLYVRDPRKSGYIDLATLARAIENLGTHFHTLDTTYDAGTKKGEDIRQSVKIW